MKYLLGIFFFSLISVHTFSQATDSLKWIYDWRELYTYDDSGNLTEESHYYWDTIANTWVGFRHRYVNEYDSTGIMIESISYQWDAGINDWVNRYWSTYTYDSMGSRFGISKKWDAEINEWKDHGYSKRIYDSSGNLIETIHFTDDPVWIDNSRLEVYTYDSNGNETGWYHYHWDTISNDWYESCHRVLTSYDSAGNCIEYIRWQETQFGWPVVMGPVLRRTNAYDGNGNKIEVLTYNWNTDIADWEPEDKTIFIFNNDGYKTESNNYIWDTVTLSWRISEKSLYIYDFNGDGYVVEEIKYSWDHETSSWKYYRKYIYTYDENGNILGDIWLIWDSEINDWTGYWVNVKKTYDSNGNLTEEIWYEWDATANKWVPDTRTVQTWDSDGNLIEIMNYRSVKVLVSATNEIVRGTVEIYPNPFSEYTSIKVSENLKIQHIDLIDIRGRIVRTISQINDNPVVIRREGLPGGIYLLRIRADSVYVKQVIIR